MMYLKSIFKTKTFWGLVMMITPWLSAKLGMSVDEINAQVTNILSVGGFILGVIGRLKASAPAKIL